MLAKGCFAVCSTHPLDEGRPLMDAMLGRMRSFCDADEMLHALASPDGRCLVGSIAGKGQERWVTLGSDPERGAVGVMDGWLYADMARRLRPEKLGDEGLDLRAQGNGMYTAVSYHGVFPGTVSPGTGVPGTGVPEAVSPGTGALQRANDRRATPGSELHFLTDPFSTTPMYYGEHDGLFVCAASLPLVAALLGLRERDEDAISELLCFTEILTDATTVRGIRRGEPGTLYTWDARARALTARRFWSPIIGDESPNKRNAIAEAAERFAQAVRRTTRVARAHGDQRPVHAALTGGLDSRTIWAVLLHDRTDAVAVVHAAEDPDGEGAGNDLRIARAIARRYGIPLREVLLGEEFLFGAARDLPRFLRASNGLCSGDLMHLPYLYRRHAAYTHAIIDGVNTYSERRQGLRRVAAGAASRQALADAVWSAYFKPGLPALLPPHARNAVIECARARLLAIIPDPKDFASPTAAAEALYLTRLIGRHGNDASAVQNHAVRYMTPYFDLDYVDALLCVPEPRRSAERVQDAILRRFAPALRSVPRSYADVRTLPVAWRPLQLLPVALQRHAIELLPRGLHGRLDLRRGGSRYAEWFSGPLAPLFDAVRRAPAPFDAGAVDTFLRGLAAGEQGDTHAAGFLLGQFSDRALL